MYKIVFIGLLLFFSTAQSFAQDSNISLHTDSTHFEDIISTLEKKTGYYFYYNPVWVDSLYLTIDADNESLEQILTQICESRKLSVIFTDNKKVIFTKNYKIKTNYATAYLKYLQNTKIVQQDTTKYSLPKTNCLL